MLRKDFKTLLLNLNDLTHLQKQKLQNELKDKTHSDAINLIKSHFDHVQNCPHCLSNAFCRCGVSKNKPFCNGSHIKVGLKDWQLNLKDYKFRNNTNTVVIKFLV